MASTFIIRRITTFKTDSVRTIPKIALMLSCRILKLWFPALAGHTNPPWFCCTTRNATASRSVIPFRPYLGSSMRSISQFARLGAPPRL